MTIYVFTDSRGINHDIKQSHLEKAYRTLIQAGFEMHEAHDKCLDYIIAQLQIGSVNECDLLYGNHPFQVEDRLLALVNHKLMIRDQLKTNKQNEKQ